MHHSWSDIKMILFLIPAGSYKANMAGVGTQLSLHPDAIYHLAALPATNTKILSTAMGKGSPYDLSMVPFGGVGGNWTADFRRERFDL